MRPFERANQQQNEMKEQQKKTQIEMKKKSISNQLNLGNDHIWPVGHMRNSSGVSPALTMSMETSNLELIIVNTNILIF